MTTTTTTDLSAPTAVAVPAMDQQMDIVSVGHVDHGKSTVIGRLLADTGSLPEGKLDQVRANCARNARPFEYAFLLDALRSEQDQGITIDTARCFFKTAKRHYIIHDAPGHIEFIKNMVTGAARAEAALLVIDAEEGIQENSKRHGYILSMLGLKQVSVIVNKMDLVDYRQDVFEDVRREYTEFLNHLAVSPCSFIPVSAREGENLTTTSEQMPWYTGPTVLEQIDAFPKQDTEHARPFRMAVQGVYKFTEDSDDRRIIAGTVETGEARPGDAVTFLPSGKRSTIRTIECFNAEPPSVARPHQAVGFTLTEQIYVKPGELMVRLNQAQPRTGTRFLANLFWMGQAPMIRGKRYKIKLGAARLAVELVEIRSILDASELTSIEGKSQIDRHDVGECVLETVRPVAFDHADEIEKTSRFVIVDNFEIAGCGIILEQIDDSPALLAERVQNREIHWEKGYILPCERAANYLHTGKFVVLVGNAGDTAAALAKKLELQLFLSRIHTYFLSLSNVFSALDGEADPGEIGREEQLLRLGELARLMTDAGLIFITALVDADQYDLEKLKLLNQPNELFVVTLGLEDREDLPAHVRLPAAPNLADAVRLITNGLNAKGVLPEYQI